MDTRSNSFPSADSKRSPAWSRLHLLLVFLALTGFANANAADTDATRISSEQTWPARLQFDANKLDLNIYGLAYHPDRETVAAMNSKTYNHGVAFVGMFPLVTYDFGPVKVNAVYFPKVANYNEVAAFGFYVSIPLGRWMGDSAQKR